MGKRLVIAEKPSVARDIAKALGGMDEVDEHFEGDDFVITYAVGHLLELAEPQDYDKALRSWSIKNLPILPEDFRVKPRDGQKKKLDGIKKLIKRKDIDGLVNACDAGREGELIFRRIMEYAATDKPTERLWLQSMTPAAIREAFQNLRPGTQLDSLGDAAWARAVGDWLVGMNATRALTQRLKSRGEKGAWSAGRVQTPTLNLLVLREREILAHEARPYWILTASFKHTDHDWTAELYDKSLDDDSRDTRPNRLFDKERVDALIAALSKETEASASEKRRKSKQSPPGLFDLTTLQREANKRNSFSAKRTLDAAQRLYEGHKLITYPRTDSKHLPDDYREKVTEILESMVGDVEWGQYAEQLLADGPENLDKIIDGKKVSDHFAIIPTGTVPETALTGDDAKIYELVCRRFLAAMMPVAIWSQVERLTTVVANGEEVVFRKTARSLEVPGFLAALGREEGDGTHLPALVAGEDKVDGVGVKHDGTTAEEKETRPPARYSEAQLLRMMETAGENIDDDDLADAMKDRGLGTPATRADTIEGLVRKQYARRVEGRLGPTAKAMRLMDVLARVDAPTLASPTLTGEWEHALQQVQQGELKRADLLKRLMDYTRDLTNALTGFEHDQLYAGDPSLGECPNCKIGHVTESAWGYPCSRNTGKDSECNFIIWKERYGRYIDRRTAETVIRDGQIGPVEGFVDRYGRTLTGTLTLEKDEDTSRWNLRVDFGDPVSADEAEEVIGELCPDPVFPDSVIVETNLRYVSKKLLDKEVSKGAPVLPKVVCHREISTEEALAFFSEEGKTEILNNFISRRGRPFRGLLFRKPTGKHGFEFPPREGAAGKKKKAPAKKKKTAAKKKKTAAKKKKTAAKKKTTAAKKKTTAAKKKTTAAKKKTTAAKKKTTAAKKKTTAAKKKTTAAKKKKAPAKKKSTSKAKSSGDGASV